MGRSSAMSAEPTFLGGRSNNVFRADLRNVNIMLFEGKGQGQDPHPLVMIKDMSGPQQAQAEVYLAPRDGRDRYMDQLNRFRHPSLPSL